VSPLSAKARKEGNELRQDSHPLWPNHSRILSF
jgi:hypothetical protein